MFSNITNQYSNLDLEYMFMAEISASMDRLAKQVKPIVGEHTNEYAIPSIRGHEGGLSRDALVSNILDVSIRILKQASPGAIVTRTSYGYIYEDSHGKHQDQLDDNLNWQFCRCSYHKES